MQKKMESKEGKISGALARGYCDKDNETKVLDPVLINLDKRSHEGNERRVKCRQKKQIQRLTKWKA